MVNAIKPVLIAQSASRRWMSVDVLRGLAIVAMMVYHFCFDLNYFHLTTFDFNHKQFWLSARAMIVALFLSLVGISLHLATLNGVRVKPYLNRLGYLIVCAGLVSLASYRLFPESGIFFGILHFIALASVLGLLFARFAPTILILICGISWLIAGLSVQHPWFDQSGVNWIGMMTHKPITEDYVPLFPWFGVVLIGLFLGRILTRPTVSSYSAVTAIEAHASQRKLLTLAGRHSLVIYMLHQPVLMGLAYGLALLH